MKKGRSKLHAEIHARFADKYGYASICSVVLETFDVLDDAKAAQYDAEYKADHPMAAAVLEAIKSALPAGTDLMITYKLTHW